MANAKTPLLKRSSTTFLQAVIVLIGVGALALMLWEPHLEGRNAHATPFEIYFKDPFLAYAYVASIPFFAALYQAFKVLGYAGQNRVFSQAAVNALRTIKLCAVAIIGFVAVGEVVIMFNSSDDRAGGVFIGVLITFGSIIIAAAAATFERILQNAVDIKSENELTV
jgi:cytochrome bd-type quinol oxidase subunit 2